MDKHNEREGTVEKLNSIAEGIDTVGEFDVPDGAILSAESEAPKKPKRTRRKKNTAENTDTVATDAMSDTDGEPSGREVAASVTVPEKTVAEDGGEDEAQKKPRRKRRTEIEEPRFTEADFSAATADEEKPKRKRRKKAEPEEKEGSSHGADEIAAQAANEGKNTEGDKSSSSLVTPDTHEPESCATDGDATEGTVDKAPAGDKSADASLPDSEGEFSIPEGEGEQFTLDIPETRDEPEGPRYKRDATLDEMWAMDIGEYDDEQTTEAAEPECECEDGECESSECEAREVRESVPPRVPYKEERYNPKKPRRVDGLFDFIELFVFTLVAVIFVTTFFVRHSVVRGPSMLNTLKDGDILLISNVFYEPERGDIIIVEDYTAAFDKKEPIVKRVIAIGGDTVRVTRDKIYVNGKALSEPYVYVDSYGYEYSLNPNVDIFDGACTVVPGEYYEVKVPEGEIFVLGDHRNDSADSRTIGTVREDAIIGRVLLRLFPFDTFGIIPKE